MSYNNKPEAVSAGGVIARIGSINVEILLLRDRRYDAWTLPKGHVEEGETLEQAALREISEEAGVTEASVLFELGTFRRFVEKAQEWKTIHYFLMSTAPDQPLGKYENKLMETHWFPILQLPKMYLPEQEKVIVENRNKIISGIKEAPIRR
jgi:ADP-ribose pyrophosphatase YjhB (NUDIX family)